MEQKFSKKEALKFGWETMKTNFWFFVGLLLIIFASSLLSSGFNSAVKYSVIFLPFLIAAWVFQTIIGMGTIKISLNFADGQKGDYNLLFSQYRLFFRYLGAVILYGLLVIAGLILLIVPGIIWALKYQFVPYFIIDKNAGIKEAFKKSALATQGSKWNLFLLALLSLGINILGAIALGIGLFATIPTVKIAYAHVYRKLSPQAA